MIRSIFAIGFAVLYLILGLPVLGVEWIVSKINKPAADISQLRMVQWAFKVIMKIAGTKVVVLGLENVPTDRPVLYTSNHGGIFDILVAYSLCPTLTGFIAKDSIEKIPSLRVWMRRLYCLFLNRDNPKEGLKVILTAIEYVKSGVSIFIFPEGTRSKDGLLHDFKEGSFKIATKTNCPIIPVAISGTADILENNNWKIKKRTVVINYGTPIDLDSLDADAKKKIGAYTNNIVAGLLEENKQHMPA